MFNRFFKSGLAGKSQKTLQRSEWNPDKDRDARGGEKHPFLPKPPQQVKMPYAIYAEFEALVRKIPGCEREQTRYTEKTERHEAFGYSYMVVRSDGEVTGSKVYRGENAVGTFLSVILEEEEKIRESLAAPKPIEMTAEDWEKFRNATDCHICNKSLLKDEFLDSLPVWNIEEASEEASEKWSCWGQGHKKCFYMAQKNQQKVVQRLKRLTDKNTR